MPDLGVRYLEFLTTYRKYKIISLSIKMESLTWMIQSIGKVKNKIRIVISDSLNILSFSIILLNIELHRKTLFILT